MREENINDANQGYRTGQDWFAVRTFHHRHDAQARRPRKPENLSKVLNASPFTSEGAGSATHAFHVR